GRRWGSIASLPSSPTSLRTQATSLQPATRPASPNWTCGTSPFDSRASCPGKKILFRSSGRCSGSSSRRKGSLLLFEHPGSIAGERIDAIGRGVDLDDIIKVVDGDPTLHQVAEVGEESRSAGGSCGGPDEPAAFGIDPDLGKPCPAAG